MRPPVSIFATIVVFALVGCSPEEVPPESKSAPSPDSIAVEATSEKVTVNGEEAIRMTSNIDDFSITLPTEFRGCVLTEKEIDRFAANLAKVSATLSSQVSVQAQALRPLGGVVYAMNMSPKSVADGFADNMNLTIKGYTVDQPFEAVKATALADLKKLSPNSTFATLDLDFKGSKMAEIRIVGTELAAGKSIKLTRFVYIAQRDRQVFTANYACASSRAPKVAAKFRASALSLAFN